jgi:hypothetical protein
MDSVDPATRARAYLKVGVGGVAFAVSVVLLAHEAVVAGPEITDMLVQEYVPPLSIYMNDARLASAMTDGIGTGGRVYATTARYESAAQAASRLGLPKVPTVRVDIRDSTSRIFRFNGPAAGGAGGPGGGPEFVYDGKLTPQQLGSLIIRLLKR